MAKTVIRPKNNRNATRQRSARAFSRGSRRNVAKANRSSRG